MGRVSNKNLAFLARLPLSLCLKSRYEQSCFLSEAELANQAELSTGIAFSDSAALACASSTGCLSCFSASFAVSREACATRSRPSTHSLHSCSTPVESEFILARYKML